LKLKGTLREQIEQLDERETELLNENETLRLEIAQLKRALRNSLLSENEKDRSSPEPHRDESSPEGYRHRTKVTQTNSFNVNDFKKTFCFIIMIYFKNAGCK
jgi:regulator of replication initiation timing